MARKQDREEWTKLFEDNKNKEIQREVDYKQKLFDRTAKQDRNAQALR